MKRYSWIFALILALTMVFIFTGCPEESKTTPTPTPTPNPNPNPNPNPGPGGETFSGESFTFKLGDTDVEGVATAENGTVAFLDDGSGYKYTYADGIKYARGAVIFKVTLPDGKKLGDYEKITATFTGISGDAGLAPEEHPDYTKNLFILAANDDDDIKGKNRDDSDIMELMVNTTYFDSHPSAKLYSGEAGVPAVVGPDPQDFETDIVRLKDLTGDVWISFYVHAEDGSYTITDIVFVEREGEEAFKPVTDITYTGVTTSYAGFSISLAGVPVPADATKSTIVWTTDTAGATITNNKLTATTAGQVTLTATIVDGKAEGEDFVKDDITITINALGDETLDNVAVTGVTGVTTTKVLLPEDGGGLIAVTGGFTAVIAKGYGNSSVRFKIDLGTKTLGNYEKVTIKIAGVLGDFANKNIFLLASNTEADVTMYKSDDAIKAVIANSDNTNTDAALYAGAWGVAGTGNGAEAVKDLTIKAHTELTGEVWFSIYLHGDPYVVTITEITFVEKE